MSGRIAGQHEGLRGEAGRAMTAQGALTVVAYHYVRDLPRTRFPRIKGLPIDTFRRQIAEFSERYELATLDAALEFLQGTYQPTRDLCLLTFDDGLKEHWTDVMPVLRQRGLQGCFFPATTCLLGRVATVHKIHFLMAALEFDDYRRAFHEELAAVSPGANTDVPAEDVARAYPWDSADVGALKYLANFVLPTAVRDQVIDALFVARLGDETAFAADLYLNWDDLRAMQADGMVIGGHSHAHLALSGLEPSQQASDLSLSAGLLRTRLRPQAVWPFAYPYGRHDDWTVDLLRELEFTCAFTVESGANSAYQDPFRLRRFDTNQLLPS